MSADDREAKGRALYEADVARRPLYHDGVPRPKWERLRDFAQETWMKEPAPT